MLMESSCGGHIAAYWASPLRRTLCRTVRSGSTEHPQGIAAIGECRRGCSTCGTHLMREDAMEPEETVEVVEVDEVEVDEDDAEDDN